jgi:hypothetical protein
LNYPTAIATGQGHEFKTFANYANGCDFLSP